MAQKNQNSVAQQQNNLTDAQQEQLAKDVKFIQAYRECAKVKTIDELAKMLGIEKASSVQSRIATIKKTAKIDLVERFGKLKAKAKGKRSLYDDALTAALAEAIA